MGSQPGFPLMRNTEVWDICCGSQSPMYLDAVGDLELRIVVHKSVLPLHRQEGDG